MKFNSFFVFVLFLLKVKSFSQNAKANLLQKAFADISKALTLRNHGITVIVGGEMKNAAVSAALAATASIPHSVVKFTIRNLKLNTSAIVSLESTG